MKRFTPFRWLPPPSLLVAAVVSGALLAMAYPPVSFGLLSFIALVPVVAALYRTPRSRRDFFRTGYVFGAAFFLGHLWWIVELSAASSITIPWLMVPALIALVAYLALYPALTFLLAKTLGKGSAAAAVLLIPALWALGEVFRSTGELGFSWGVIGYSLASSPMLIQGAALGGVFGVGGLIVLVNMLWSRVFMVKAAPAKVLFLVAGTLLVVGNAFYGSRVMSRLDRAQTMQARHTVAVVQPNVDLALKWEAGFRDSTFRLIERFTREAALAKPDIVIFPETCAPVYLPRSGWYRSIMERLAREQHVAIYIGYLDGEYVGPDSLLNVYNSSGLFTPDGRLYQYSKMHLLPFGEAIPFAWKFRRLARIDFGQANFHPGPPIEPIPSPIGTLAPMICFESIFPDQPRRFAASGADVFVNITNDGWFGDTPGPDQHTEMAILRSVENRRYLLRSANTGVSMVVDPAGRIVASLGLGEEGVLVANIRAAGVPPPYTRFGDRPVIAGALVLLAAGILIGRRGRGGA